MGPISFLVGVSLLTSAATGFTAPQIHAHRITNAPPKIDGAIDDEVWKQIEPVTDFTQQEPDEGAEPTEKTEVRIAFDERHLYIAFRCFDREPDKIDRRVMRRDFGISVTDSVSIVIDPYGREHDGFYFHVNANGAVGEGKLDSNSRSPAMNWDALWDAAAKIDELGWTAEMVIPFRSLNLDPAITEWSLNLGRTIRRRQERIRWTAALRNRSYYRLEDSGRLTGIEAPARGLGLDLKPYTTVRWNNGSGFDFDMGGDAFYQVTPNLTGVLTLNTDFAETEVDRRQVNLTRFPLFFPERRDFFIEGAEFFNFGAGGGNVRAFHSRTIGLSGTGEKVDIPVGLKLTGRENRIGVGMFGSRLASQGALESDEIFVGRLTYDIFDESRIGTFVSRGDPRGNADNTVAGVDLHLKDSAFVGDNALNLRTWGLFSRDDGDIAENVGIEADYLNQPLGLIFSAEQVGADFRPGTGFVRRRGRRYRASGNYDWFPDSKWIQNYTVSTDSSLFTRIDNAVESRSVSPAIGLRTRMSDVVRLVGDFRREVLFQDFEIRRGHVIPAGDYSFNGGGLDFFTTFARPVTVRIRGRIGEYYHGHWKSLDTQLSLRLPRYFQFSFGGTLNDINLPEPSGRFDTVIGFVSVGFTPSPNFVWNTLTQWDTVSDQLGIQSRIRWIVRPGQEMFLVLNQGFDVHRQRFTRLDTETATKVGLTFRF